MLTQAQLSALRTLAAKARVSADDMALRDLDGKENVVARVRRTRKGKKTTAAGRPVKSDGAARQSEGKNGNGYYLIRRAAHGQGTGLHLYCSCPAQRFHAGYGHMCKHVKKLVAEYPGMLSEGKAEGDKRDVIVYRPDAIMEAVAWTMDKAI